MGNNELVQTQQEEDLANTLFGVKAEPQPAITQLFGEDVKIAEHPVWPPIEEIPSTAKPMEVMVSGEYPITEKEMAEVKEILKDKTKMEEAVRGFLSIKGDKKLTEKQNELREFATVMAYGFLNGKPKIFEKTKEKVEETNHSQNSAGQVEIIVDRDKLDKQVKEITETDFFQDLQSKARALRMGSGEPKNTKEPIASNQVGSKNLEESNGTKETIEQSNLDIQDATSRAIIATMEKYTPQTSAEEIAKCRAAVESTEISANWTAEVRKQYLVILEMARQFAVEGKRATKPLDIFVDKDKLDKQVKEIADTNFFAELKQKAERMRVSKSTTKQEPIISEVDASQDNAIIRKRNEELKEDTPPQTTEDDMSKRIAEMKARMQKPTKQEPITGSENNAPEDSAIIRKREPVPTS